MGFNRTVMDAVDSNIVKLAESVVEDIQRFIRDAFSWSPGQADLVDPEKKKAILRVATLAYCKATTEGPPPANARVGILTDIAIKKLSEKRTEHIRPGELKVKNLGEVAGFDVDVVGAADLVARYGDFIVPIEVKSSNRHETVRVGHIQAGIYAWLYDAPFAVLMYGPDLTMDVVLPLKEELLKKRAVAVLGMLLSSNGRTALCPETRPKVILSNIKTVYGGEED